MFRSSSTRLLVTVTALTAAAWSPIGSAAEVRIPRQPGLPPAAEEVLVGFEARADEILARSRADLAARRTEAVASLQSLLLARMQAADLDGALAIRQMIRSLEGTAGQPMPTGPLSVTTVPVTPTVTGTISPDVAIRPDPGDLTNYRTRIGEQLHFTVRGELGAGGLWGTGYYTHDSTLSRAAVHAGVLQPGEHGVVCVTIHQGPRSFSGSTRNGTTSGDWSNAEGYYAAYTVERPAVRYLSRTYPATPSAQPTITAPQITPSYMAPRAILPDPGHLGLYFNRVGESFLIELTGVNDGTVWGTDCYTYDSDLSTAAVHAGVVAPGARCVVRVTMERGAPRFVGSTRNGVVSHDWDNSGGHYTAYRIEAVESPAYTATLVPTRTAPAYTTLFVPAVGPDLVVDLPDPGTLLAYRGLNGRAFYFRVTGNAALTDYVWGTDIYTDDSRLAKAAVHAGALKNGETGVVRVTILPGQASYAGGERNGVRSEPYPAFSGSYRVERHSGIATDDTSIRFESRGLRVYGTGHGTVVVGADSGARIGGTVTGTPAGPVVIGTAGGAAYGGSAAPAPTSGTIRIDVSPAEGRVITGDTDMQSVDPGPGRVYYLRITGRTDGQVWGSDVYTSDSSVGTAAVHAGVLRPGQTGVVKVTIVPGKSLYEGSTRHGITTYGYRDWDVSYRVERDDR